MNKVILMGNLGQDAEERFTGGGKAYCTFSIATTKKFKGEEETQWHSCVMWGKEKLHPYLKKGTKLLVEGELTHRSWEQDGQRRYKTEVTVWSVEFGGGGQQRNVSRGEPAPRQQPREYIDDIPF